MIKAVFFDIDGTLVNNQAKALASTKYAIDQLQKKGILCGVATGRSPVRIKEVIDELELDMFVVYNGQLVFDRDQTIVDHPFDKTVLADIVHFSDAHHRQIIFGGRDQLDGSTTMMLGQSIIIKKIVNHLPKKFPVRLLKKILQVFSPHRQRKRYETLAILNEPIYQCILLSQTSEQEKLIQRFPECSFQRSNPYTVDIIPKGGSKLLGIQQFATSKGMALSEIMAFGDHYNDVEMLKGVGIGVAMGNAPTGVKQQADFVTASNEADGIYKGLKHFGIVD
ncbi:MULTISPECIES: Cof-type HAD-IIB family hydrolase [Enterococcus]|uniref:HAD superfamily hydrolase n=1 Tax=Enterococcus mundtii TaxID=53346 RepID=A0A1L8UVI0_ENTMU|nr:MULTISPECIES: Cof-type HAD-IIB family hydrolase [Enterococcus]GEN18708.1 haloacid dehalogenase [Ligilactobacillus acidipiscis]AUB51919.1 haloacid dehalogenase [Enterococcus mundtii]MDB7086721.1 Cof-type HAD-IIB family hydrolase [Enterococcus mundtii]MZZ57897.1 Cof-type HAD-IIB family hydrolase [Enterococcus mundtii]MZZ60872.1 Cof-type HAD-IIB family hydrolase [Enterococcus mundtii]